MATNERKIQLGVEVDASKARQGFNEVKQSAADMAQSVAAQGNKAGKAIDNIGSGGAASSQKVETATRSMIQSIQRTTAAMEAGSRSSAQYYETLANQRGISTDALRPYLAQLEAVEAKQKGASGALASGAVQMDRYGMSAKATAAAMRGVPAQLTDIMVSLQGGQRPMTVLMQQGGQLKDMFGGIVPAARALGTAVLGMINPFTLAASAAGALYMAYRTGAAESEEFNRTLITTGNAIGLTTEQLNGMAQRIDGVVGTQRNAAAALNEFARSIKISSGNLEDFAATAIRWEQATGQAVAETVKQFEELGKAPLQASLKLNESMNYLTDSIYEQIKALEDQGQETAAAELAQIAFADALDSRTPQMLENIGSIERGWNAIKRAVSEAVDAMAGIGRASTLQQQLAQAEAGLSQMMDGAYERGAARRMKQVEAQRALIASIQEQISLESGLAMVQKQADQERARSLKAIQDVDAYVSDSSRMSRAAQMEKALNDERQIYEKRVQDAAGNADKLTAIEQAYQTKVSSIRDQFAEKEAKRAGGSGGSRGKSEAQRELERQQREELRMIEAFERERAKLIDGQRNEIAAIEEKTRRIEDEITMYGMGQAAIDALAISRLEEQRAMLAGFDNSEQQIALLDREIAARKRLMSATSQKEALDANKRAAEEAARDWERITDQIGQSLTDALMDGGRSAKRFLEDMFRTMVLRPMLQPAVNGVTGAIGSALGIPGAPNSGLSSGGGILGAASNIKTLYAGITGGLTASLASGVSAIGSAIGSSAVSSFAAGMQGNTLAAGLMGPTTAGAGGAMGAGAMFASAMPWLAGGAILYSLLGDKFKGETRYGGSYYVGDMAEGTKSYLSERPTATRAVYEGGPNGGDPAAEAAKQLMVSTYASLTDAAKQLGGSLEDLALFGSWEVSPEKGNSFVRTIIAGAEGDLYNNKLDLKGVKDSEEVFAAFQAELPKLIIAALQQVDLDDAFDSFLDQIDIAALDEAGVQAVLANLSAMVQFRDALANLPFEELAGLSLQAGLKMAEFSGGMEPLLANMNTYFQAFYSQEEQLANLGNNIAKSLEGVGVAMPATNAEFRAIVESLDVTTEAGQQAYAVMMGLSGSFNQLTAGMDQLAQANTLAAERAAKDQAEAIETVWRDQVGRVQRLAEESSRLLAARNGAGSTLDQIDRAMGRTGQFAGQREAELWAAMATASYEQQIDLASELTTITLERYQQEVAAAERLRDLGASLRSYVEGLRVGDLSPGTMGEKLAEAGRQYADALAKAQSGDTDAMSGLQGMADAYLRLARGYYASSDEYSQIFNSVTGGLDELGVQAQSDAERQIAVGVDSLAQLQALHDVAQGAFDALDRQYQQSVEALAHEASLLVDLGQDTGRLHDIASLLGSMPAEIAARLQPMMDAATRSTVGSWYQDAGRGQGDASGVDYWQGELGKRPEGEVQDSFLWGLIADWYKDDLGRRADENEIAYWFEQAKKNGTQAAYQAFLAGARSELHGSHANGLAYVPFDGYRAELHEGEGVLTAAENRAYQAMPDWSRYGQGGDALVVEVRALRDEVKQLRAERQKGDALVAGTVAASAQANAADVTKGVTNAMSKSGWAGQQAKEATYK